MNTATLIWLCVVYGHFPAAVAELRSYDRHNTCAACPLTGKACQPRVLLLSCESCHSMHGCSHPSWSPRRSCDWSVWGYLSHQRFFSSLDLFPLELGQKYRKRVAGFQILSMYHIFYLTFTSKADFCPDHRDHQNHLTIFQHKAYSPDFLIFHWSKWQKKEIKMYVCWIHCVIRAN